MNRKDVSESMFEVDRCREELDFLEELDALVKAATLGDRDAVGAIAIAFGPMLLQEARAVLGEEWEHEGGDALQDLTEALMDRKLRFHPSRGSALPFLRGVVRGMARRLRKRLEKTRGDEG